MKINILILLSLIFSLSLISSCNKNCEGNFEWNGEECVCPTPLFGGHGMCRELQENEYYGITQCNQQDTLFIRFEDYSANAYKMFIDLNSNLRSFPITFIEFPTYDSLYFPDEALGATIIGDRKYPDSDVCCMVAHLYGRLTPDMFKGRIDWKNNISGEVIESCPFEMVR